MVRNVGVSNFSRYQLRFAQRVADIPIAVNQIEYQPYYQQPDLARYCREHDIAVAAAAPLGRTAPLSDETIQDLAAAYEKTPAQIILRWQLQRDLMPLPRSGTPAHVRENAQLFDWELKAADCERIDGIEREAKAYEIDPADAIYGIES